MSKVYVKSLSKTYPCAEAAALDRIDLSIEEGSLVTAVGASGSGKTTFLRILAGLERQDSGIVQIDGVQVAGNGVWFPPEKRGVGLVFQEGRPFPSSDGGAKHRLRAQASNKTRSQEQSSTNARSRRFE